MAAGNWYAALRLAASWPDAEVAVRKGWEASIRPEFQQQLGRDADLLKAAGIAALKRRFANASQ